MAINHEFTESVKKSDLLTESVQMKVEPGTYEAPLTRSDEAETFYRQNQDVIYTIEAGKLVDQNITFTVEVQVGNDADLAKVKNAIRTCCILHGETAFKSNEKLAKAIKSICGVKCAVTIKGLLTSYGTSMTVQGFKAKATVGLTTDTKVLVGNEYGQSIEPLAK